MIAFWIVVAVLALGFLIREDETWFKLENAFWAVVGLVILWCLIKAASEGNLV